MSDNLIPATVIEAIAREMWENIGRQMVADGLDPSFLMPWSEENEPHRENWRNNARTALKAAESAGWVLVPVEPTEAMVKAVRDIPTGNALIAGRYWKIMLAAAPKVP